MEHDLHDVWIKLEKIEFQIGRLVSDAESEKDVRRDRNNEIDRRISVLEVDKIVRDTTVKNIFLAFKILAALNFGAIVTFLIMIIKYFGKN